MLAREVAVHAPAPHDAAAVFGVLRAAFGSCFVFCAGRGDAAFVAASPELLVRREGHAGLDRRAGRLDPPLGRPGRRRPPRRAAAALRQGPRGAARSSPAGSPARCAPHRVWVDRAGRAGDRQGRQHPAPRDADPRAAAPQPVSAIELAGLLHPTPAVGGEPHAVAAPQIPALEGLDRGWYAGPVGWTDANEDGEFCVALRCALLRGREARLYAGVGVVRDSDPAAELAETEVKLGALLPVLPESGLPGDLRTDLGRRSLDAGSCAVARSIHSSGARRVGSRGLRRVAEREHGGDLRRPRRARSARLSADAVADAVGAGADAERPGGEHHVLRGAAGVDAGAAAHRGSPTTKAAPRMLPGSNTASATRLARLVVADDEEGPRLAVLGAARHPPGVEDARARPRARAGAAT